MVQPVGHLQIHLVVQPPRLPVQKEQASIGLAFDFQQSVVDVFVASGTQPQQVPRRGFPAVDAAFDHCRALGLQAQLSGTGASLFMTFNSQACAQAAQAQIQGTLPTVLARGLQRSTLLHALGIAAN